MRRYYTKDDVELYPLWHNHELPSVNVKAYNWGRCIYPEQFGCSEQELESAMQYAWEVSCESFWEDAQELAKKTFPYYNVKVYAAGRSGGHLVVKGLDPVETWDAIDLMRWRRFEKEIRNEVDYLCTPAVVRGLVEDYFAHHPVRLDDHVDDDHVDDDYGDAV